MRLVGKTPVIKSKEIKEMFDNPKRLSSLSFVLLYKKSERMGVAFTVKKHVSKNAVMRNRIKRILREAYQLSEQSFPSNCNLLFIGLKSVYEQSLNDVKDEMVKIAGKVNGK
ncbi:MAG: ribonuclease P protein component [bacterium (Candidatus Stahlbacteria) CG23_combo_of_CG06-09_8_20_14_all_34_7]|nr:MAG: ribonuclease P protein component [bacterium (Candidatus Stahlbacteria) CG23_combo_of_CG06-09_8_20_14_all_34_7]